MFSKLSNILSLLLICLCIYGGSGFYLGQYCCNVCLDAGVEAVSSGECHKIHNTEEHSCCEEHIPGKKSEEPGNCHSSCFEHEKCCNITTYKFDADNSVYKVQINIPVLDVPYLFSNLLFKEFCSDSFQYPAGASLLPKYSSREILTLHSVLLI
ncbi:MAG: hypothetical protein FWF54_08170 [Candidatus Azobacteroides sp.]|nr:hypothetical protein [Candidatus Azobacteroides sp.]